MRELLRSIRLTPYARNGPSFTLRTFDTGLCSASGSKTRIAYEFRMRDRSAHRSVLLFAGDDFFCSPMHAIDSDECVRALLSFLTLRPGDTDREYFAAYTPEQLEYAEQHAESLSAEVSARFGEE